jgi:pyruvate/2-oxoglutarate dehydrogenase complex dihydrolipoamide dehydrogenase (E3) component
MTDLSCDLLVIGAGSGGLVAAKFGARLGVRVTLVDRRPPGGDCLYTGCVPSKALLKAARVAHEMRTAKRFGLSPSQPRVDLGEVMDRVNESIAAVFERDSPDALAKLGVTFMRGSAAFVDEHVVEVTSANGGAQRIRGERIILATGARAKPAQIDGLSDVAHLTYENVFELRTLPRRLLVVGNGPIGAELAQAFQRLGSAVTLFCPGSVAVAKVETDMEKIVGEALRSDGIDVRLDAVAKSVRRDEESGEVVVTDARGEIRGDALLVAAGRVANVDGLALSLAHVALDEHGGIRVDEQLRTSVKHVYACGDCTGGPQFTHYAGWQGYVAARNALLPGHTGASADAPWVLFTEPEIAHVGLDEKRAREIHHEDVVVTSWPLEHVDRAQAEHATKGLIKIIHTRKGLILGADIAADRAGEMIGELALAIRKKATLGDIAETIHVYPTYSIALQELAAEATTKRALTGLPGRLARAFAVTAPAPPPGPPGSRWLFTMMGAAFLAQGTGKALDVGGYRAALEGFQFVPERAIAAVSALWLSLELAAGLALVLAGLQRRPTRALGMSGPLLALGVSVAYAVLDLQGYARGLSVDNCTCFGVYLAQRLSWFVLLQEAYVIWMMQSLARKASTWPARASLADPASNPASK